VNLSTGIVPMPRYGRRCLPAEHLQTKPVADEDVRGLRPASR